MVLARVAPLFAPESPSVLRVFRHRDFRLLFFGALFSFFGSWIQNVAQGYLVYEITGSKEKLALVSFLGMIPVTFLGPVGGGIVDSLDRRKLLAWTQVVLAAGAGVLAVAVWLHFIQYWMVLVVALVSGTTGALEMPARQAVVGTVVPPEDLAAALPMQAMPFNLARVVGPAIGGWLVARYGPGSCYLLNALSFGALVYAALAIQADLRPKERRMGTLWDIVREGAVYVFRESRLRRLFIYETCLSLFGLFYLSMLPAIAKDLLKVGADGLGRCYTAVGVGAVVALLLNSWASNRPMKGLMIKVALTIFTVVGLSYAASAEPALIALTILGFAAVVVFNTSNLLFQLVAPPAMRGRAISMHVWAISGIGPFGVYAFGWLAERIGLPMSLKIASALMALVVVLAWVQRSSLEADVPSTPEAEEAAFGTTELEAETERAGGEGIPAA